MKYLKIVDKICNFLLKVMLATALDALIIGAAVYVYIYEISDYGKILKVTEMYKKIVAQTGQVQDALPLNIVDSPVDNAYTDGKQVVMFTGFIKSHTMDELALVMGHEIAHYNLGHLNAQPPVPENDDIKAMGTNGYSAVLEANADKMGAVYMMKAGYDICKGREIYKTWEKENGNYQAQTHPDYPYRYAELNINCD